MRHRDRAVNRTQHFKSRSELTESAKKRGIRTLQFHRIVRRVDRVYVYWVDTIRTLCLKMVRDWNTVV